MAFRETCMPIITKEYQNDDKNINDESKYLVATCLC